MKFPYTIDQIRQAYQKLDYKPFKGQWICNDERLCCPMTALVCVQHTDFVEMMVEEQVHYSYDHTCNTVAQLLSIDLSTVVSFACGFDGSLGSAITEFENAVLIDIEIYEYGKMIAEAIL